MYIQNVAIKSVQHFGAPMDHVRQRRTDTEMLAGQSRPCGRGRDLSGSSSAEIASTCKGALRACNGVGSICRLFVSLSGSV